MPNDAQIDKITHNTQMMGHHQINKPTFGASHNIYILKARREGTCYLANVWTGEGSGCLAFVGLIQLLRQHNNNMYQ